MRRVPMIAVAMLAAGLVSPATAEQRELGFPRLPGVSYTPFLIVQNMRLVEKHVVAAGLPEPKVTWTSLAGANVTNDALLSGSLHFVSLGAAPMALLWDRTRSTLGVKGMTSVCAYPLYLNTRNPTAKSLFDLGEKDRIAVPAVKISLQAILLQMEVEKRFGIGQHGRLDHLTVGLSHPDALASVLNPSSEVTTHFATSPFHEVEKKAGLRTILSSYDILGGQASAFLLATTEAFRRDNPKTYAAVLAAVEEAMEYVNADKRRAVRLYLQYTGDKSVPEDELFKTVSEDFQFTRTPQKIGKFVEFMHRVGSIKTKPESWKDLFFPEAHQLPGD